MRTYKKATTINRQVLVNFRNRLLAASVPVSTNEQTTDYEKGWEEACRYFAHELYKEVLWQDTLENESFRKIR